MINFIKKKKCIKFPYKLGVIKCVENPCIECRSSGRIYRPFPEAVVKIIKK